MRVLWITQVKPPLSSEGKSGGWVSAAIDQVLDSGVDLAVAYPGQSSASLFDDARNVSFFEVKVSLRRGKIVQEDQLPWEKLIEQFMPDIIQIWGTEYATGLNVIKAAKGKIPCLLYIQGVATAIAAQRNAGVSIHEMAAGQGVLAHLRAGSFFKNYEEMKKQSAIEREMACRCDGIICDSDWCEAQYRALCPDVQCYRHFLPLKNEFIDANAWSQEECERNTVFTIAGRSPLKGLHELIRATVLVKERIPAVKVVIPGNMSVRQPSWLRGNVYIAMLNNLIDKYHLNNNIIFSGALSTSEMVEALGRANVFVMPSCVENHSSSLREAMAVGVPCVSSAVGSVPETIHNGYNGYIYRYGDVASLADGIIRLLEDEDRACRIGEKGRSTIRKMLLDESNKSLFQIYTQVLGA